LGLRLFLFFFFAGPALFAQDLLQRYFEAIARQADRTRDIQMEMDFDARLLKLQKVGHLTGTRYVARNGHVEFAVRAITGDDTVKKHVIARYLAGEQENSTKNLDTGINDKNYKFKFKRVMEPETRRVHVYEISPRKKRVGLYKGELWIDEETALPVRESGQFSKSPSPIFLKKVSFTRTYLFLEGVALPTRIESVIETRIAGKAELVINYTNFRPGGHPPAAEAQSGTNQ
jgi:hypothetical protein